MNQPEKQHNNADPETDAGQTESVDPVIDGDSSDNDENQSDALPKFVTSLAKLEEQVGLHVINALQKPQTFAVLTTVTEDHRGSQKVVSIALDAERFEQIQKLLSTAKKERKRRVRCIGFHCHFDDDDDASDDDVDESGSDCE